jgi:hypothetical protein
MTMAVVIQCFAKSDTLAAMCESLLRAQGHEYVRLIFWCDNANDVTRNVNAFRLGHAQVLEFLLQFSAEHRQDFADIEIHHNSTNLGPCPTCQIALDYAFVKNEFVLFAEDDVIFSRDIFIWCHSIMALGLLNYENIWAIAAESPFFDAHVHEIPPGFVATMQKLACDEQLARYFVYHEAIPSSVFATTRRHWAKFGQTRGQPMGDVDLNARCNAEKRGCIYPVVPRAKDDGMLHDLGHSVAVHTKAGVSEIKHTYLLSEDVLPVGLLSLFVPEIFSGEKGKLWLRSTLRDEGQQA